MSASQINKDSPDPDKPLCEGSDEILDFLGRHPLASRIADLINSLGDDYKDNIVIGIEGQWGVGKTSLINLILQKLHPDKANLIVEFNPLNLSNQDELLKNLIRSIVIKLDQTEQEGRRNELRNKFIEWLKNIWGWLLGALRWLRNLVLGRPSAEKRIMGNKYEVQKRGLAASLSLGVIAIQSSVEWGLRRDNDEPLTYRIEEMGKIFREYGKRIIIVMDDIDRLDGKKITRILNLVRLVINCPNIVFLLAYNRLSVSKLLDNEGISGEEYLKKVIQVSFLIPKPDPGEVCAMLKGAILKELKPGVSDKENWDEDRFNRLVDNGEFNELFSTIRDIQQYMSSLHRNLKIIDKKEVNLVDFIGIEAIRVFAPEVHHAMINERLLFTRAFSTDEIDTARKEQIGKVVAKAPKGLEQQIRGVIHQLFPQVKALETNEQGRKDVATAYTGAFRSKDVWVSTKRVCSEEMYDKYFQLSVPKSLLSVGEMEDFISKVGTEDIKPKLKEFEDQGKIRPVSRRLRGYLDDLSDQQKKALLIGIFDFAEKTKDRKQGPNDLEDFSTGVEMACVKTLWQIEKENRVAFLVDLILKTQGFFVMNQLLNYLSGTAQMYEQKGTEYLLTEQEMADLRNTYAEKIKSASQQGPLVDSRGWGQAIRIWKMWGSEEEVRSYVEKLIKTDEGVLTLIRGFDRIERSPIDKSTREMLEEVIEFDKLDERVNELLQKGGLSKADRDTIDQYQNPPSSVRDRIPKHLLD